MNISIILIIAALILTLISAVNPKIPLWVAVLVLCLALLAGRLVL